MNKVLPLATLATAAIVSTLVLNGCNDVAQSKTINSEQKHLNSFLTLHSKYCEKKFSTRDSLKRAIEKDASFTRAKGFEGVYETYINEVSFAVSPEEDGCTTDVMVKKSDSAPLFLFEDINNALLEKGYKETGKQSSRLDVGTDQTELTIIEKTYISPNGEITTLDFPLEKMDKYYMTLFAEKFTDAKQETKEKSEMSLKMASAN